MTTTRSTGLSKCCWSEVIVASGEEGTNFYQCTHCGEACDLSDQRPTKLENIPWKKELILSYKHFITAYFKENSVDEGMPMFWEFIDWLDKQEEK